MIAPMRIDAPLIPRHSHRLSRLHRWAMLWLKWFAAFLDGAEAFAPLSRQARAIAHTWLDKVEHLVVSLVMVRAAKFVRPAVANRHVAQHKRKTAGLRRAIIGSRLRRALRHNDVRQRIAALGQDIDTLAELIAHRAPRGLTRRRAIAPRAGCKPAVCASAAPPAAAHTDTS